MTTICSTPAGKAWLGLGAVALLAAGCAPPIAGSGVYAADFTGAAKACSSPAAALADGQTVIAAMKVSNEGGWCGITVSRGGSAFDTYMMTARPAHGTVFAHHVGGTTRIDYTPVRGFAGTDSFAVRLVPGNAVLQGSVTVTH